MKATTSSTSIEIHTNKTTVRGTLAVPPNATSIIVFAHGLDSSNFSPRNRLVARSLLQGGLAILLPDLTGEIEESPDPAPPPDKNDIAHTASRLVAIIDWLAENPATSALRIGLFGGRTGAAAAMIAAAARPETVHAVVSRGGRPDLADDMLREVKAPTLMIVGSNDPTHIGHNRRAGERMPGKPMLELIPGATHLFGEPGKLEQVASISYLWFQRNLAMCG